MIVIQMKIPGRWKNTANSDKEQGQTENYLPVRQKLFQGTSVPKTGHADWQQRNNLPSPQE